MRYLLLLIAGLVLACSPVRQSTTPAVSPPAGIAAKTKGMQKHPGFFVFYREDSTGKVWLEIDKLDTEFLYVESLSAGLGSNDIGLDRGQLGDNRVVVFTRSGNKVLLQQRNYSFRAGSANPDEQMAVAEAFTQPVLWGFTVAAEENGRVLVDLTPFLLQDAHRVADRLKQTKQGAYKADESRSALYLPRTRNFPKNTEFEATLTFTGEPAGDLIRAVSPTPEVVTVRQHLSFIELPGPGYSPRVYDPRAGFFGMGYADYATPVDQPLMKRVIFRHRLQKKDPSSALSDPVAPIVYYMDPGAPEPIKSALMEGASWWNQAFEAAGYRNAFQVRELPANADPMDVRYNIIQWVHRSTRGWSYGSWIADPRTGEIIKGKVSLGSLRVRQDFLIAQGLLPAYGGNNTTADPRLLEMALARLRQLSAHEVGHTLGLTHNFAASTNSRASVMDYPHPVIALRDNGAVDFSSAYDDKIGAWDKRAILYGYQDFSPATREAEALDQILAETQDLGLRFLSDQDARPEGSAHPHAHLWDNGTSPVRELERLTALRQKALQNLSLDNLPTGAPVAELERVLVPLYLAHRYQLEAVAKLIGGLEYTYAVKGFETRRDNAWKVKPVPDEEQDDALMALLGTLDTRFLEIPGSVRQLLPPQPMGYGRDRETFPSAMGLAFDPFSAAETSVEQTLRLLLNPERLARLVEQKAAEPERIVSVPYVFGQLLTRALGNPAETPYQEELARLVDKRALQHLLVLAASRSGNQQVTALALAELGDLEAMYNRMLAEAGNDAQRAHLVYQIRQIGLFREDPATFKPPGAAAMPEGAPIGCQDDGLFFTDK